MTVLVKPLITEQTLNATRGGWYTFVTKAASNKAQIASEIAKHYKVKVTKIRTMTMPGKTRRVGRKMHTVTKIDWKKALVKLGKDQKISDFEVEGNQK